MPDATLIRRDGSRESRVVPAPPPASCWLVLATEITETVAPSIGLVVWRPRLFVRLTLRPLLYQEVECTSP